MTNRYEDAKPRPCKSPEKLPPLPVIDWSAIGCEAPAHVDLGDPSKDDPLPKADIVVMTWTSAEWAALDHVFANSGKEQHLTVHTFRNEWHYRANKEEIKGAYELWGYYRMVKIKSTDGTEYDVLLYKSSAHLSHPPYCKGLIEMVKLIIAEAKPDYLYTIGTAGGTSLSEKLGDTVITNAGHISIEKSQNKGCNLNNVNVACKDWFPSFDLVSKVEEKLLFKLSMIVTEEELEYMLCETIHGSDGDPTWEGTVTVADLVNEAIDPSNLDAPKGLNKKDVPLLTTDYYYIAHGDDSIQYSALEMDDAVVGFAAGEAGANYVFVRNISDPLVPDVTKGGKPINAELRKGWSGQIYKHFGMYTAMNGALLTWATIAGAPARGKENKKTSQYDPPRRKKPIQTGDPLEVELVHNVRPCGTCTFFWPEKPADQSYGPYPMFDFTSNFPVADKPDGTPESYPWMRVVTRDSGFPNGEVMDGCRKVPIMTIGINPNMTAFSPGRTGTSWAYPGFSDDGGTDGFAKYAFYYRYRNVYQERFDFDTITRYLLNDSQIVVKESCTATADQVKAAKDGYIVSAERPDSGPTFDLVIKYEGEDEKITVTLQRDKGKPRYVLLFDHGERDQFKAGDAIAAKLNVPAGEDLELYQALQTYYEQFVPSLDTFNAFLKSKGHTDAALKIGEDVGQLDMVGCASPHWNKGFLGGTQASEDAIISNCVSQNAWAMKQLVQTRPAVLFLVGEHSYTMFRNAFGKLIHRDPPLPTQPYDYAFTLFRESTDSKHPTMFEYATTVNGRSYSIKTRLIITPHFSYDDNFLPQFRLSKSWLGDLEKNYPKCVEFLKNDPRIKFKASDGYGYNAFTFEKKYAQDILDTIQEKYPDCWKDLESSYYDAHRMMASVLEELYQNGALSYKAAAGKQAGYLTRTEGSCHFCANNHWKFPAGCPYGKPKEEAPPAGFLDAVTAEIVTKGK